MVLSLEVAVHVSVELKKTQHSPEVFFAAIRTLICSKFGKLQNSFLFPCCHFYDWPWPFVGFIEPLAVIPKIPTSKKNLRNHLALTGSQYRLTLHYTT